MAKLTVNNKYQGLFDMVGRYQRALNNKKETYLQLVRNAEAHSPAQTDAFDAAFILDFMMESNQQLMSYLDFIQRYNNRVMNQTLNKVIALLDKNADIEPLLLSINDQISKDNELIRKQRNYYLLRSILSGSSGMLLSGVAVTLIILAGGMSIFAIFAAAFVVVVIGGLGLADAINSEEKYHDITRNTAHWSDKDVGNYVKKLSVCIEKNSADNRTIDNRTFSRFYNEQKTSLSAKFFKQKKSADSPTLNEEVTKEYMALGSYA